MRLVKKARGASISPFKGVLILLISSETDNEENNRFMRCVHYSATLRCIVALRDSASAAVICLQRILVNENAKLKVKGKLQLTPYAMYLYSSTKVRWLLL